MLIDSTACPKFAQNFANDLHCPNISNFSLDLYFDLLVHTTSNIDHDWKNTTLCNTNGTNIINITSGMRVPPSILKYEKMFGKKDVCWLPNFYCDSYQTPFICNKAQEKQWLTDFYYSTNGDNWINNSNWLKTDDYCLWHGVRCCNKIVNFDFNIDYSSIDIKKIDDYVSITLLTDTCMNAFLMNSNNVSGILPKNWFNSTIFTILEITGNPNSTLNPKKFGLKGNISDYSSNIPNIAVIALGHQFFDHGYDINMLPKFGSANCTISYDIHNSFSVRELEIPDWSEQKYMVFVFLEYNKLKGTIPDWSKWIWPYEIALSQRWQCGLTGNIPSFNKSSCPVFQFFYAQNCNLNGTIDSFPNTLCVPHSDFLYEFCDLPTHTTLDYSNNQLSGTIPFDTLTTPGLQHAHIYSIYMFVLYIKKIHKQHFEPH